MHDRRADLPASAWLLLQTHGHLSAHTHTDTLSRLHTHVHTATHQQTHTHTNDTKTNTLNALTKRSPAKTLTPSASKLPPFRLARTNVSHPRACSPQPAQPAAREREYAKGECEPINEVMACALANGGVGSGVCVLFTSAAHRATDAPPPPVFTYAR